MPNTHPVDSLMQSTMENLREMIDVNTVVGEPIETQDGTCIVPISRVTFGFASGGSEFNQRSIDRPEKDGNFPFGGGSGAGVTVKPIAFLVIKEGFVKMLTVEGNSGYDKLIDSVPQVLDSLKGMVMDLTNKRKDKTSETSVTVDNSDNDLNITIEP